MRPGRISTFFLLLFTGWATEALPQDRDHDGLSDKDETAFRTDPLVPDSDGDGLLDGWEVHGYEFQGFLEPLASYGAKPDRKDVFVEIDWMASEGETSQLNAVIAYQAAVDVTRAFRDSNTGIAIHFDLGPRIESMLPPGVKDKDADVSLPAFLDEADTEKVLPYQDRFPSRPSCDTPSSLLSLYDVYYGGRYFRPSRRNIFFYVVIAEQSQPLSAGGAPEGPGRRHSFSESFSDELAQRDGLRPAGAQISVIFRTPAPDVSPESLRYQYSVDLLHELGHAFGLGHGGALSDSSWDNTNYKPNYLSIMNYRYEYCGVKISHEVPIMDFSHGETPPLAETSLMEPLGMGTLSRDATNDELLRCAGLIHLEGTPYPDNMDWNRDHQISGDVMVDINENNRIDNAPFTDHDDWGKFVRKGFDGIGLHAFRNCGMACAMGEGVVRVAGDFNADGLMDLFLFRGDEAAWALSSGDGKLVVDPRATLRASFGSWTLTGGGSFLAGDFLGTGRDMIFAHRGKVVAIFDFNAGSPALRWFEDEEIGGNGTEGSGRWKIGASDRFLPIHFSNQKTTDLAVTNGRNVALLTAQADADPSAMTVAWNAGDSLRDWVGGESTSVRCGRSRQGRESLFISSATHLIEVLGPPSSPRVTPLDREGILRAGVPAAKDWALSSDDCILPVDLDGDRSPELLLRNRERIAVAKWLEDSPDPPVILWSTSERVEGVWPMSENDRVYHGQFLPGGGEEVVISKGQSLGTFAWNKESSSLDIVAINAGLLGKDPPTWELRRAQPIFTGRFLPFPGDPDLLLIQDRKSFVLARMDPKSQKDGFFPVLQVEEKLGSWLLGADDVFLPGNFLKDPEPETLEILARRGNLLCIFDFSPTPQSGLIARLSSDALELVKETEFLRGDANGDDEVDISDVVAILGALFLGFHEPSCMDAADANDNGRVDVSDPIRVLAFLFNKGDAPPAPGPYAPGIDPTLDLLDCKK
jgi:hypothetical protein